MRNRNSLRISPTRDHAAEAERFAEALLTVSSYSHDWSSPSWLRTAAHSHIWLTSYGSTINWEVQLEDGSRLTEEKNSKLLRFFRSFLIGQTHFELTKGVSYSRATLMPRMRAAENICEYILLRSDELMLSAYGLDAINESFVIAMLNDLATLPVADSVYQWTNRAARLLLKQGSALSSEEVEDLCDAHIAIRAVGGKKWCELTAEQLVRARAWLWKEGLYRRSSTDSWAALTPDFQPLVRLLYPRGTLRVGWRMPRSPAFDLEHSVLFAREKTAMPVRGSDRSEASVRFYKRALTVLPLMRGIGIDVPSPLEARHSDQFLSQRLDLAPVERFRTPNHEICLAATKCALEFIIENTDELLASYLRLIDVAHGSALTMGKAARQANGFASERLKGIGVRVWSLADSAGDTARWASHIRREDDGFFDRMRANHGLYELLQVLWGSCLVILGTLMARRQGEIVDLDASNFLDPSERRLLFRARKRNAGEYRQLIARPVPAIVAETLKKLANLQTKLIELGIQASYSGLLSSPRRHRPGLRQPCEVSLNKALDRFCDYFELDDGEKRHYLRLHQFRRFFAQLFFWGNSYSGLETLRWFLGHADPEHLYRYITESIPGEVMRDVKIDFALTKLADADPSVEELSAVLKRRFLVDHITLIDPAELTDYLTVLLDNSALCIEPEFFKTHEGIEYTVVIIVKEADRAGL